MTAWTLTSQPGARPMPRQGESSTHCPVCLQGIDELLEPRLIAHASPLTLSLGAPSRLSGKRSTSSIASSRIEGSGSCFAIVLI